LNAADTTIGGGINDLINLVGTVTLDGALNITGSGDFTAAPYLSTWTLMQIPEADRQHADPGSLPIGQRPVVAIAAETDRVR
jgi:hypothetical protein